MTRKISKTRYITIAAHVMCWAAYIFLPYFSAVFRNEDPSRFNLFGSILFTLPLLIIFYANYSFLAGKFLLQERKAAVFFICNILAIAICLLLSEILHEYVIPLFIEQAGHRHLPPPPVWEIIIRHCISLILFGGLGVALRSVSYVYEKRVEMEQYKKEKIAAELQNLKSQLNPHFLFNSLNNIYVLAGFDSCKTQQAIHDLSDLLRYVLYRSNCATVPLRDEISFIRSYCELMKLRLDESVKVSLENTIAENPQLSVAPMLFIVLVENAFKHGINPDGQSDIEIKFSSDGERRIYLTVRNGNFPKSSDDKNDSGIGIGNMRQRLKYAYPGKHEYRHGLSGNTYTATLQLDL